MEFKDYYQILNLKESATVDEIKKTYRKLARKYHPDVSSETGAEDKFKEIAEAYAVLKNPEKRKEYDALRAMGARGSDGSFTPPPDWKSAAHSRGEGFDQSGAHSYSDFFEQVFGQSGTAHRSYRQGHQTSFRMRGEDVHHRLPLFLEEACNGCEKQLRFGFPEVDDKGLVTHRTKTLNVTIPAGMIEGQHLRLKGQGAPGIGGGPAGDLLLEIQLAPHPVFQVDGKNLIMPLPITPWEAVLGATVSVPTLTGMVNLKIPANSQAGNKLKLKGKGMPGKSPGDLVVQLKIVLPTTHTDHEKALYQQLKDETNFDPRSELKGVTL